MENGVNLDEQIYDAVKVRKTRRFIIIAIVSLLAAICALIAFFFIKYSYRQITTVSFDNYKVYQYFSNLKYEYDGVVTIENGKTVNIGSDGGKVDVGDTPIYFQTIDNEAILTTDMALVFPSIKNYNYRLNCLSKIIIDEIGGQEDAMVTFDDKEVYIDTSFLYNGDDIYFFPYSVSLKVNDETILLSPLSYVIAPYGDSLEIYDKKRDKYLIIDDVKEDVIAILDQYKINLSTDMIMYENNDRLLIKNISKLKLYEGDHQ